MGINLYIYIYLGGLLSLRQLSTSNTCFKGKHDRKKSDRQDWVSFLKTSLLHLGMGVITLNFCHLYILLQLLCRRKCCHLGEMTIFPDLPLPVWVVLFQDPTVKKYSHDSDCWVLCLREMTSSFGHRKSTCHQKQAD